jgi:hypothetical protein
LAVPSVTKSALVLVFYVFGKYKDGKTSKKFNGGDILCLIFSEFTMAEIEHFVDPEDKDHPHFADVKDISITLLAKEVQLSGKTDTQEITVGEAVEKVSAYEKVCAGGALTVFPFL